MTTEAGNGSEALVTVVVPARNEEGFIEPCLDSILTQDEPRLEVIVVDGESTDRTPEIVRSYAARDGRVELIANPDRIVPSALNRALERARGRWLVRVDAHATVPPDYVSRAVRHLETGRWGGVGGRKDGVGRTPAGRAVAAAMGSRFGVGDSAYHYATSPRVVEHIPFGAYPTDLARRLGGWDERLRVNQDFEFDHRVRLAGYELLFDPDLRILWHSRQTVPDLFRQYLRYGRGKAKVARLHPDSLHLRHLVAPSLVGSWVAAAALFRWAPWLAALAVGPYALALGTASVATARRVSGGGAQIRVPLAFGAMHVGWGLGFLWGVAEVLADELRGRGLGSPKPASEPEAVRAAP